jgi:hypothetical protein
MTQWYGFRGDRISSGLARYRLGGHTLKVFSLTPGETSLQHSFLTFESCPHSLGDALPSPCHHRLSFKSESCLDPILPIDIRRIKTASREFTAFIRSFVNDDDSMRRTSSALRDLSPFILSSSLLLQI